MTNKYQNIGKVIYMSAVLCIHSSVCLATSSLLPEIADQHNYFSIGQIANITTFIFQLSFNLIGNQGPLYLTKLPYKIGFTLQAMLLLAITLPACLITQCNQNDADKEWYCSYTAVTGLTIFGFACFGSGFGGYFVLQNAYISECSKQTENQDLLFGVGYVFMGFAFLISSLYSEHLIKFLGPFDFFICMGIFCIFFSLMFLFVQEPNQSAQVSDLIPAVSIQDEEQSILKNQTEVINNEEFKQLNFTGQFKIMMKLAVSEEIVNFLPLFLMTGTILGLEYGDFYKFIKDSLPNNIDSVELNQKTYKAFQLVGSSQALGVIINTFFKKRIGILNSILIQSNLLCVTLILLLINSMVHYYGLCLVLGFMIGYCDFSGQTNCAILIAEKWKDSICVYGLYQFFQNIGVILFNLSVILLSNQPLYYTLILILILQMANNILIQKEKRKLLPGLSE